MNATTRATTPSASAYTTPAFWERLWRSAGLQCVALFIVAYLTYGYQPPVDAPAIGLLWVVVVSQFLLARVPATRTGW